MYYTNLVHHCQVECEKDFARSGTDHLSPLVRIAAPISRVKQQDDRNRQRGYRIRSSWGCGETKVAAVIPANQRIPLANSEPARTGPYASPRIEQPNLTLRRQLRIRQRYLNVSWRYRSGCSV